MTSRKARALAPEWPQSLRLEAAPTPPVVAVLSMADDGKSVPNSAPTLAFLFATLKDGRYLAAECTLDGRRVAHLLPLHVSPYAPRVGVTFEAMAHVRLCLGREYTPTEAASNTRDGGEVRLEHLAEGHAIALVSRPKVRTVALGMELEGGTVLEPRVLAQTDKLSAWAEAYSWAQRTFLPRRYRR